MTRIPKFLMLAVAVVALMAATATAATLITGKQVKNKSLTGKDVKPASLGAKHLSEAAKASLKGNAGPAGEPGAKGEKGDKGDRGPSTVYAKRTEAGKGILNDNDEIIQTVTVPDGSYVLQAKAVLLATGNAATEPNCRVGVLRGLDFEALDQVDDITVTPMNDAIDTVAVSLMAVATVDNGTNTVELRCAPGTGSINARDRTLIATQVAELK